MWSKQESNAKKNNSLNAVETRKKKNTFLNAV